MHSHRTRSRDLLRVQQGTINLVNVSVHLYGMFWSSELMYTWLFLISYIYIYIYIIILHILSVYSPFFYRVRLPLHNIPSPFLSVMSSSHNPTDCQKVEKLFLATLLKTASHHIPTGRGRRKLHTQQVPAETLAMMEECADLCKQDPTSPRLSTMNDEIAKATSDHKRRQWRELVESIDHRTNSTKLWPTIKGMDGKFNQTAEN